MIHIDSKITIWDRMSIKDEHKDELLCFLKENPEASASDIADWAADVGIDAEYETLTDSGAEMTPEENGGERTLEVLQYGHTENELLWSNQPPEVCPASA